MADTDGLHEQFDPALDDGRILAGDVGVEGQPAGAGHPQSGVGEEARSLGGVCGEPVVE